MRKFLSILLTLSLILGSVSFGFAAAPRDVAETDYATAVDALSSYGVISSYPDGTFKPNKTVTQTEAITMLLRALGFSKLDGTRPGNYTQKARELKLFSQKEFTSKGDSRGTVATLIYGALNQPIGEGSKDTLKVRLDALGVATVLKNGIIYTVEGTDWDKKAAQAMAIAADGKILFVGTDAQIASYIGTATKVVDLKGKTVLPGLIDSHNHPIGTAFTELYQINLYYSSTYENSIATIKEFVAANPDLEIYWGNGFNMGMVDKNGAPPNKAWLDAISPNKPMLLTSNDGHNNLLNSAALKLLGIDSKTKTPVGGNIHKDSKGEPTGLLTDCGSLINIFQEYTPAQVEEATVWYLDVMNGWGYTSFSSSGVLGSYITPETFTELESESKLTLRMNYTAMMEPETYKEDLATLDKWKAEIDSSLIEVTTAKFFIDGVIEGVTGYLSEPYTKEAGMGDAYVSEPIWSLDLCKEAMLATLQKGYQIHVHSIGDEATTMTLDSIEYAQTTNGKADYRNIITHLQLVKEADKPRFGKLGIIAAVQPFWHFKEPEWYETVDQLVLGEERAWTEYPLKSLKDNGAILTASGDYPVSPNNNPFWGIEAAVTRNLNNAEYYGVEDIKDVNDPKWLLNPNERVDVKTMIEAYTINGAYQMYREDEIGSLKAGKWADFIIVDKDVMKINQLDIDGVQVSATVLAGNVVSGAY